MSVVEETASLEAPSEIPGPLGPALGTSDAIASEPRFLDSVVLAAVVVLQIAWLAALGYIVWRLWQ